MTPNPIKVLAWNTEKGPVEKRQSIEALIRTVAPGIAFLFEASNSFDRSFPYPDWIKHAFGMDFEIHESPERSPGPTGPTGMIMMVRKELPATVHKIQKRYAIASCGGALLVGLHLKSPERGAQPTIPQFFTSENLSGADVVCGDFNQLETETAAGHFTGSGFSIMNPDAQHRASTCQLGLRAIDHTLAKPGRVEWVGYENNAFAASDHVAQVLYWIPSAKPSKPNLGTPPQP